MLKKLKEILIMQDVDITRWRQEKQEISNFINQYKDVNLKEQLDAINLEYEQILKKYNSIFNLFNKKVKNQFETIWKEKSKLGHIRLQLEQYKERVEELDKEINSKINQYNSCKNLKELSYLKSDLSFEMAISIFNENNIPFVLEEDDCVVGNRPSNIYNIDYSKLVLIHKTNVAPNMNQMFTARTGKMETLDYNKIKLYKLGVVNYQGGRNTVHFTVNGEVEMNNGGSWNNRKYAVILPFIDLPRNQIKNAAVMDTYIEGTLSLPTSTILLCPIDEVDFQKKTNPNIRVLGYNGENVTGYANALISMMGYTYKAHSPNSGWYDSDGDEYNKFMKNEGYKTTRHEGTQEQEEEIFWEITNRFKAVFKKIIDDRIVLIGDEKAALLKTFKYGLHHFRTQDYLNSLCHEMGTFLEQYNINFEDVTRKLNSHCQLDDDILNKMFIEETYNLIESYRNINDENLGKHI